ncbi:ABC transporter ATP-binding protein [Gemmatimonadota bacterium]
MIQVEDLHKSYGETVAVNGISFTAEPGRIFGLLGPNGAGKTTSIDCIAGVHKPTSGRILVGGHDIVRNARQAKSLMGVVPQEVALYEEVSARENLHFWGGACGLKGSVLKERATEVLELIGLIDRAEEAVKKYSGGMKRRLNFGCGVMHSPPVLLLDEPTVGIDPQSRVRLLDLVREQAAGGVSVLYTTHYMEEAEALCDEIAIIDHGTIHAQGTLEELRSLVGEKDMVKLTGTFDPSAVIGGKLPEVEILESDGEALLVSMMNAAGNLAILLEALHDTGATLRETSVRRPSLETLFIKMTGKELRE